MCGCPRTLAICGICFDDSVPANIMYGYAGSMCMGLRSLVHSVAKRFVKRGEAWHPHDRRAVDLGVDLPMGVHREALCSAVTAAAEELQRPRDPTCRSAPPCA